MGPRLAGASRLVSSAVGAVLAVGCATPRLEAQWKDPALGDRGLPPGRLQVICEAPEVVLGRLCADELRAAFERRGLTVVAEAAQSNAPVGDTEHVAQAVRSGAGAVWIATLKPEPLPYDRRSGGLTIGLGGFEFGRGGGVGVGVTAPIGGSRAEPPRYAADVRLIDAASAKLMWTARASAPSADETPQQIRTIAQRLVDGAGDAKLFAAR